MTRPRDAGDVGTSTFPAVSTHQHLPTVSLIRTLHHTMPASDTVCCPPQAPRPKVAHPVASKSGYEPAGTYERVGDFDKVYVVSLRWTR